jgi:hypothetical protein
VRFSGGTGSCRQGRLLFFVASSFQECVPNPVGRSIARVSLLKSASFMLTGLSSIEGAGCEAASCSRKGSESHSCHEEG